MRDARTIFGWAAVCLVLATGSVAGQDTADTERADAGGARVLLELGQNFYYAGDPLQVRVSIGNDGPEPIENPVRTGLLRGFEVTDENGATLEATGKASTGEPARPDTLSPAGFYGAVIDLTELYPALSDGGRFRIRWTADGIGSETIAIQIIPKYDPNREYRATLLTDEGRIVLEFFQDSAPIAVKAFIDMAHSGVYDGLLIHEIHPDDYVVGGSPAASGDNRPTFTFPAEPSSLPVVAGTVLLRPVSAAPPANSSPFMIALRPRPEWRGQATVIGQVVSGLDVVRRISRRPSSAQSSKPFFKPLKDVRILGLKVEEKEPPAAPGS
jgi:peptidyl-prolyl cis-trans isomerase B (cyclophilin B)